MKRCTLLLIALVATATAISAYEPPTDSELTGWWESLTREQRLEQLRRLDIVEHETPDIDVPAYLVTVTDSEVILTPRSRLTISVGHLSWAVSLPQQRAAYEPETHSRFADILTSGAVGIGVGVLLVLLLN